MKRIKRTISILMCTALLLCLLPTVALAADTFPTDVGADFTTDPTTALAALNAAKTGSDDSTWDSGTKTLTLKGVNYTATASGAVKLPADATIVLADGTTNTITGGNTPVVVSGGYSNKVYIYGIYAEGDLTIKSEANGTGTLTVTGGNISNSGNSYTYSVGLYGADNLTVEGGAITAKGGTAQNTESDSSNGYATSAGIMLARYKGLTVTGGSLTGIGGEARDNSGDTPDDKFSYGIYVYEGNTSVSGSGKLTGQCVDSMAENGLAYGIHILNGNLTVSDSAEVSATACTAIDISGSVTLSGGKITANAIETGWGHGLSIDGNGNLTVSGGELTVTGKGILMYQYPTDAQGVFSVSGGTVTAPSIYGANKLNITGGTAESGHVGADTLTVSGGTLTIREAVKTHEEEGVSHAYASPAISCKNLTVTGGTLDAAWDWGSVTPMAVDPNSYTGDPKSLVSIENSGTASFSGGTTLLDTGYAGNVVINVVPTIGGNVNQTGDTGRIQGDNYREQMFSDTPVVFSNVTRKTVTVENVTANDKPYDNSISATLSGTLSGVSSGDDVSLKMNDVCVQFDNKNVGTNKTVNKLFGQFYLHGRDAYKYALTQPVLKGLTANITPCTTVFDTTTTKQTIYKGSGTFDQPHIIGSFGDPTEGPVLVDSDTGTITYTVADAVTNGTYDDVVNYLKTLDSGTDVTVTYKFTGNANYANAKFADENGNPTDRDTGTITIKVIDRPSSGGGSVSTYAVSLSDAANGDISASHKRASKGSTVTVTVTPDEGYELEDLAVTDAAGKAIAVTETADGTYTFKMPYGNVKVAATFIEVSETPVNSFVDVSESDYYYDAVQWAAENGITEGTTATTFSPNAACTRAQMVTFLWRAAGSPAPKSSDNPFADVEAGSYYYDAVLWAIENGITNGTSADAFSPNAVCTRAQTVTFLYRAAGTPEFDAANAFTDVNADAYYTNAVDWAVKQEITNGTGNNAFSPNADCTRAQIVTFLYRDMAQ